MEFVLRRLLVARRRRKPPSARQILLAIQLGMALGWIAYGTLWLLQGVLLQLPGLVLWSLNYVWFRHTYRRFPTLPVHRVEWFGVGLLLALSIGAWAFVAP